MAPETKAQRAIRLYREAADAADSLPSALRRTSLFGITFVNPDVLREEADWLERVMESMSAGNDPA